MYLLVHLFYLYCTPLRGKQNIFVIKTIAEDTIEQSFNVGYLM